MSVDEAPRLIAHNPLLDTEFKLTIYSLYKQIDQGDANPQE